MKFNIDDFISSVPVLRLFAKNLALNAGIAFVIQDFLIPLYSNYIFDIVSVLLTVGILSFFYWIFIFKKKSKNYAHFSLQISLVCLIFAIMVGALSSVSKAFSSDDRGILASNVDFVAELQDNTNIYDEKISSLGRDISRVSSQFSELQSDLSSLSEQIASQISDDGSVLDNEQFLEKISTLIDEKNLQASVESNAEESDEVAQLRKNLDIATELLRQVTLANVNLQKKEVDNTPTFDDLSADSIVFYIGELKGDINDLRNFSLQLLANTALADTRSELNTFKNETKKDLEDLKEFTSLEIEEIKEELANLSSTGGSSSSLPDPSNNISVATGSQNLDNSGISELKYYIVELMKDQNEIRQIVKDLRDILEEKSDD